MVSSVGNTTVQRLLIIGYTNTAWEVSRSCLLAVRNEVKCRWYKTDYVTVYLGQEGLCLGTCLPVLAASVCVYLLVTDSSLVVYHHKLSPIIHLYGSLNPSYTPWLPPSSYSIPLPTICVLTVQNEVSGTLRSILYSGLVFIRPMSSLGCCVKSTECCLRVEVTQEIRWIQGEFVYEMSEEITLTIILGVVWMAEAVYSARQHSP